MKAVWQGYIALGRLGIPVRLFTAVQPTVPKFVQLHAADGSPVQRVLECKSEGVPISFDDVVRGVEYAPGQYVTINERELDRVSSVPAKTIAITQFSDLDAIRPQFYDKPYYVVPSKGGERGYALLREVFTRTSIMAVAQVVIHNKEHIAVLRVEGDLLMLLLIRYAAELVPRAAIPSPALSKPAPTEIEALQTVVERFSGAFYIQDYHDERAERLTDLVERKVKGLPARRRERPLPHTTPENEIVPALQETLGERHMIPAPKS